MIVRSSLTLDHLDRMTDSTGLIQHAIYSVPRRESGYTTDDNARALRLCARMWDQLPDDRMLGRVSCYLSFLEHARHPVRGFHNFLSYQRGWLDAGGTGDCQGQTVLALAEVVGSRLSEGYRALARELLESVLEPLAELRSLRAQAYVIQAWAHLRRAGIDDFAPLEGVARLAADRLMECYQRSQRLDWLWFESRMTYANAVLPHALFDAAECCGAEVAEKTLIHSRRRLLIAGNLKNVGSFSQGQWNATRIEKGHPLPRVVQSSSGQSDTDSTRLALSGQYGLQCGCVPIG